MEKIAKNTFLVGITDADEYGLFSGEAAVISFSSEDLKNSNNAASLFEKMKEAAPDEVTYSLEGELHTFSNSMEEVLEVFKKDDLSFDDKIDALNESTYEHGLSFPELQITRNGDIYIETSFKHVGGYAITDEGINVSLLDNKTPSPTKIPAMESEDQEVENSSSPKI